MMQTRRRGGRSAREIILVLLGLGQRAQRRQTLGDELCRVEVGQMRFRLLLMLLLEMLVVMMVVVGRHLGSVRGRVKEAIAAFAIGGVMLLLLRRRYGRVVA